METFLGQAGPRVIFTVDGGSSARDVRRYSAFQAGQPVPEDERLLPCGTAFTVKSVGSPAPDLLMVTLQQTDDFLIQGGASAPPPQLLEAVPPEPELALMEPEPEPMVAVYAPAPSPLSSKQAKVERFCEMCGVNAEVARRHLQATGWDMARAAERFFAAPAPAPAPASAPPTALRPAALAAHQISQVRPQFAVLCWSC